MRKMILIFSSMLICLFLTGVYAVFAQEGIRQEIGYDKQQIKAQKQEISQNAQAAKQEEVKLREQIKAAMDSGDTETAQKLREQLRVVHQENLQEKTQDKQEMQAAKKELKSDIGEAQQADYFFPDAPIAKPSAGPDLENKSLPIAKPSAGPDLGNVPVFQGGPGIGPKIKPALDKDNNPPGPKGGAGTNWENKPGPQGGPGASPDKKPRK